MRQINIVGAGLTGCLLAISLAQKGYRIRVYEARDDIRKQAHAEGRSINLAISERGLHALDQVGLKAPVLALSVPVFGRMMHDEHGKLSSHLYGRTPQEHNYSLSRSALNKQLLTELSQYPNVTIQFNTKLSYCEPKDGEVTIACDGAFSAIRKALSQQEVLNYTTTDYPHAYKEIHLAKNSGLNINYLHIWPRGELMLMALANEDGSFTCTLYLRSEQFDELDNTDKVERLFQHHFPDFFPLVPHLARDFLTSPTGRLLTVQCEPWYHQDKVLLLGDAAHAMVPFLGQGMNCGFEDVTLFNQLLDTYQTDWQGLFQHFYQQRKPDADAITEMAQQNYDEMSTDVADPRFLLKKEIEQQLMQRYPNEYVSKYVMISYTNQPYSQAKAVGEKQEQLLTKLSEGVTSVDELDWQHVEALIKVDN